MDGRAGDDRLARADVGVVVDASVVVRGDGPPTGLAAGSAYAMATSGSMGAPKVALVPRPMLAAAIHRVSRVLRLGGGDRYLHLAAFGFSSSIRQLLVPLANRAAVLLCDDAKRTDPDALLAWLYQVQPTVLDLTPTMLDALGDAGRTLPDSVRTIICASERLDPAMVRALRDEQGFRGTIFEGYGTTETSGLVAAASATAASTGDKGWPLASLDGCHLHVLDRYLHPVAPGIVGELWVSVGHAAGYLGAAATATAFLPDPMGYGDRMFRTGDIVRRDGTDSISWVGRADDVEGARRAGLAPPGGGGSRGAPSRAPRPRNPRRRVGRPRRGGRARARARGAGPPAPPPRGRARRRAPDPDRSPRRLPRERERQGRSWRAPTGDHGRG